MIFTLRVFGENLESVVKMFEDFEADNFDGYDTELGEDGSFTIEEEDDDELTVRYEGLGPRAHFCSTQIADLIPKGSGVGWHMVYAGDGSTDIEMFWGGDGWEEDRARWYYGALLEIRQIFGEYTPEQLDAWGIALG